MDYIGNKRETVIIFRTLVRWLWVGQKMPCENPKGKNKFNRPPRWDQTRNHRGSQRGHQGNLEDHQVHHPRSHRVFA